MSETINNSVLGGQIFSMGDQKQNFLFLLSLCKRTYAQTYFQVSGVVLIADLSWLSHVMRPMAVARWYTSQLGGIPRSEGHRKASALSWSHPDTTFDWALS